MRAGSPLLTMEFSIGSCSRVAVIMQVSKFFETCTGLHEVRRHSSPPGTPPPQLPMFWTVHKQRSLARFPAGFVSD